MKAGGWRDLDPEEIDRVFGGGPSGHAAEKPGDGSGAVRPAAGSSFDGGDGAELDEPALSELLDLKDLCAQALKEDRPLESEIQVRRVVRRVLSRTTREDLRRRGDLGVLLEFCADRLRDSMVLRVAVAVLVFQVTIVPIVAWHLLVEPSRGGVRFVLEPVPEAALEEEFPAEAEPLSVVGASNWWDLEGAEAWLQADADFEGARIRLKQVKSALEGRGGRPSTATGVALLEWTGLKAEASAEPGAQAVGVETLIASILRAEGLLDQVQGGGPWSGLGEALERVGETLAAASAAVDSAAPSPLAVLASRTLRRAFDLGLVAPAPDARLPLPGADEWLRLIGEQALAVAPGDGFVRLWNQVVQEL